MGWFHRVKLLLNTYVSADAASNSLFADQHSMIHLWLAAVKKVAFLKKNDGMGAALDSCRGCYLGVALCSESKIRVSIDYTGIPYYIIA